MAEVGLPIGGGDIDVEMDAASVGEIEEWNGGGDPEAPAVRDGAEDEGFGGGELFEVVGGGFVVGLAGRGVVGGAGGLGVGEEEDLGAAGAHEHGEAEIGVGEDDGLKRLLDALVGGLALVVGGPIELADEVG